MIQQSPSSPLSHETEPSPPESDSKEVALTDSQLYRRFSGRIRSIVQAQLSRPVARRIDPEDIVQSVFRRYFAAVAQGRYDLPEERDLWDLLLTITLNRLRNAERFHRAARRDVQRTTCDDRNDVLASVPAPVSDEGECLDLVVAETLELLPDLHREIIRRRLEGWSVSEIANHIGRSKRTVERLLQDARERLRSSIGTEN